jgi:hypothetical protein
VFFIVGRAMFFGLCAEYDVPVLQITRDDLRKELVNELFEALHGEPA